MLLWVSCVLAQDLTLGSLIHDGKVSPNDSIPFEREIENRLSGPSHSALFTDLGSAVRVPPFAFPFDSNGTDRFDPGIKNEFGKKFSKAFEFIDMQDILVTIANRPDREPWALYDESNKQPLLHRWDRATSPETSIRPLMDLARIWGFGPSTVFRSLSITAVGAFYLTGKGN